MVAGSEGSTPRPCSGSSVYGANEGWDNKASRPRIVVGIVCALGMSADADVGSTLTGEDTYEST